MWEKKFSKPDVAKILGGFLLCVEALRLKGSLFSFIRGWNLCAWQSHVV